MDTLGSVLFLTGAAACGIPALWHEIRWRNRLRAWDRTTGTVVGIANGRIKFLFGGESADNDSAYPEIEFSWKGSAHKFISGYGGSGTPPIGSEVDVLYDPATGNAEFLSTTTRWFWTVFPLIFSVMFIWVAFQP